jgi:transposase
MADRFLGKDGFHHTHGTSAAYLQGGCRCEICRLNRSQLQTERRKQIAYGRYQSSLVDAEPVRQHIKLLMDFGIGINRIAKIAGVSHQTVYPLVYGRSDYDIKRGKPATTTRINRTSAERIMAIKPMVTERMPDAMQISNRGFKRRVQALNCLGYTTNEIGILLGFKSRRQIHTMMERSRILISNHRAMCELYRRLENTPARAKDNKHQAIINRCKAQAALKGFVPPADWDDIDGQDEITIPDALDFDTLLREILIDPHSVQLNKTQRPLFYKALREHGWSDQQIADGMGVAKTTVNVWFRREAIRNGELV